MSLNFSLGGFASQDAIPILQILRNPDQKEEYDYMLDNPEQMYYHYYSYFKRQYSPKVDVRLVIIATVLVMSAMQVRFRVFVGIQIRSI